MIHQSIKIIKIVLLIVIAPMYSYGIEYTINESNANQTISELLLKDENLKANFKSGLASQILRIINIKKGDDVKVNLQSEIKVKYDLWDEKYIYQSDSEKFVKFNDVKSLIQKMSSIDQFFSNEFKKNFSDYDKQIVFFLNPVSKAKSKIIKEWMAERFVGPSSMELGSSTNAFVAGIVNRVVTNQLDKSIYGADHVIIINIKGKGGKK